MNVVCIDNSIYPELEIGKVYSAKVIFWLEDGGGISEMDWKDNYLSLEGFTEIDWFKTQYFSLMEDWRELQIKKLGIN